MKTTLFMLLLFSISFSSNPIQCEITAGGLSIDKESCKLEFSLFGFFFYSKISITIPTIPVISLRIFALSKRINQLMTCYDRFLKCSQQFSPVFCATSNTGSFYIWVRRSIRNMMDDERTKCPPKVMRYLYTQKGNFLKLDFWTLLQQHSTPFKGRFLLWLYLTWHSLGFIAECLCNLSTRLLHPSLLE